MKLRHYPFKKSDSKSLIRLLYYAYLFFNGFKLFFINLLGYIPSHVIRSDSYRYIFKIKVPRDSVIFWRCKFFEPSNIYIGHNSIIGNDAFLDGRKKIYIGNNVNVSAEVRIYTLQHDIESPTFEAKGGPVQIDDYVYIGSR